MESRSYGFRPVVEAITQSRPIDKVAILVAVVVGFLSDPGRRASEDDPDI